MTDPTLAPIVTLWKQLQAIPYSDRPDTRGGGRFPIYTALLQEIRSAVDRRQAIVQERWRVIAREMATGRSDRKVVRDAVRRGL